MQRQIAIVADRATFIAKGRHEIGFAHEGGGGGGGGGVRSAQRCN